MQAKPPAVREYNYVSEFCISEALHAGETQYF